MVLEDGQERTTHARYWVIVFAVTLAVIQYIDRVCISKAMPSIKAELGFTNVQVGYIFGAFTLAYALFEIPGGWLGDRFGPRKVLMRVVVWWSFFTAATAWVTSAASMMLVRFLFGAGEAGCFPNITKAFTTWLPRHERVRAQGILWLAARWGGAVTPLLVVGVLSLVSSWRRAFELFGLVGIVWGVLFYRWFRDNPLEHPSVGTAERKLLANLDSLPSRHAKVPWRVFFTSRSAWLLWTQVRLPQLRLVLLHHLVPHLPRFDPRQEPRSAGARHPRRPPSVRRRIRLADFGLRSGATRSTPGQRRACAQSPRCRWLRRRVFLLPRLDVRPTSGPHAHPHRPGRNGHRLRPALRLGRLYGRRGSVRGYLLRQHEHDGEPGRLCRTHRHGLHPRPNRQLAPRLRHLLCGVPRWCGVLVVPRSRHPPRS